MDILRPELVCIEGRIYRLNDTTSEAPAGLQEYDLYQEDVLYNNNEEFDEDDEGTEVIKIDDSRYCTNFHVSKHYIGSIIGRKGAMKSRIERDTKTEIKIPRQGQTGDIIVFGPSMSNVKAAKRRINIIVMSSRMKQKSTHFISIPMNSEEIVKNFEIFKESVLRECHSRGIDESLFIKPTKLHLTVGVMCLMDSEERLLASKYLTEAKEKIVMPLLRPHLPFKLRLKGLSYMNDDPHEIDVLYGTVKEEGSSPGILQNLVDSIVDYYYKAGFMDKDHGRENVKLHVTLLNSKYRSRSKSEKEEVNGYSRRVRQTFDGSEVLQKFQDFDFGVAELSTIHLSQRHSMGPDGYYQPTCVIPCKDGSINCS